MTPRTSKILLSLCAALLAVGVAHAGDYEDTLSLFRRERHGRASSYRGPLRKRLGHRNVL
jgi:hypothetical protein